MVAGVCGTKGNTMKIIYEPKKPRYQVQYQNSDGEWEYWRGYATTTEAITEADNMAALDGDNYRVIDTGEQQ